MFRIRRALLVPATFLVLTCAMPTASQAAMIQLFSPAELDPTAPTYNYPARPPGTQPVIPDPFVLAGPGNVLTFTQAGSAFIRMDQAPPGDGGWFGTFEPATRLLYTGNGGDPAWFGPITIGFEVPILEFGLLAQFSDEFMLGPFFFTMFNGPTALGTFSRGVTAGGPPAFLGARTNGDLITSIMIRGPSLTADDNDFAIGPVTAQPIPEPTTLALLGSGLVGTFMARRWRRRTNR